MPKHTRALSEIIVSLSDDTRKPEIKIARIMLLQFFSLLSGITSLKKALVANVLQCVADSFLRQVLNFAIFESPGNKSFHSLVNWTSMWHLIVQQIDKEKR